MLSELLQSCPALYNAVDYSLPSPLSVDSPGKNTGVGCRALLRGILLSLGSNPHFLCFLHWQVVSLSLVPLGKPDIYSIFFQSVACLWIILAESFSILGLIKLI